MGKKEFKTNLVIGAVDNATKTINSIEKRIKKVTAPVRELGAAVKTSLTRATVITGAVSAGVFKLMDDYTERAEGLLKASKKLGMSVEGLQRWQYVAKMGDIEIEDFNASITKLTKNIADAAMGTGTAKDVFKALGISVKDANGKIRPTEDILKQTVLGLSKINSAALKNNFAIKLMGKSGANMAAIYNMQRSELEQLIEESKNYFSISKKDAENAERLKDNWKKMIFTVQNLGYIIANELIPSIEPLIIQFKEFLIKNRPQIQAFAKAFAERLPGAIKEVKDALVMLYRVFSPIVKLIGLGNSVLILFAAYVGGPLIKPLFKLGMVLVNLMGGFAGIWKGITGLFSVMRILIPLFWQLGVAIMATPIGWIVAGIAAVAVGAYLIYKYWKPIKAFFIDLWDTIGGIIAKIIEPFNSLFGSGSKTVQVASPSMKLAASQGASNTSSNHASLDVYLKGDTKGVRASLVENNYDNFSINQKAGFSSAGGY